MCGIVGYWNLNQKPVLQEDLNRFTDALSHRGPDGNGFYVDSDANIGLGHRRLAIIDITDTGRQPMSFGNGRYWIVFNGEIYNFVELKTELESYGYQFMTNSDTEVVLASYDKWGEDCQLRFNGMWAFAIWDSAERKLFLSRDRFGVKPLVYHYGGGRFSFASEMKAFLALDDFSLEFNASVVTTSLTSPSMVEGTEDCLLQGLKRLAGGHCLTLAETGDLKIRRWWHTLEHLNEAPSRYEDQVAQYRELFFDACRIRMRSDVSIGTALSGGLDSSSVLCTMSDIRKFGDTTDRLAFDWQKAFVGTYPGKEIDERIYADEVVKQTGVTPVYCEMNADMYLDNFHQILFQYEELSDIHLGPWFVHKKQRENGVVVTIDGHGGDEALAGYSWHLPSAMQDAIGNPFQLAELISTFNKMGVAVNWRTPINALKKLGSQSLNKLIARQKNSWLIFDPNPFYSPAMEEDIPLLKGKDALFKQLYTDFHFTHLPTNLRDFDRLSMAHGVEVRSPFMDWRLVCYTFSLPSSCKIGGGFTKKILRDAMKGILPENIRSRTKKLGFPNLDEGWMSFRAQEFIRDTLNTSEFKSSNLWNAPYILADMETAFKLQDQVRIHKAWKLLQAFYLIKAFKTKAKGAGK
jgi:asparagine synthase (glutamine-hydrolysing)